MRLGISRPVLHFPVAVSFQYESKTDRVTAEQRHSWVFVVYKGRRSWNLRSSLLLDSVGWWLFTDLSVKRIGPFCKVQVLTTEEEIFRVFPGASVNNSRPTLPSRPAKAKASSTRASEVWYLALFSSPGTVRRDWTFLHFPTVLMPYNDNILYHQLGDIWWFNP